jgi:hypothetical protein
MAGRPKRRARRSRQNPSGWQEGTGDRWFKDLADGRRVLLSKRRRGWVAFIGLPYLDEPFMHNDYTRIKGSLWGPFPTAEEAADAAFAEWLSPLEALAALKNPMKPGWELWLTLDEIEPFVPLMEKQGVSKVARSKRGFLTAYRKAKGHRKRLGSDPKFGQNWAQRRNNFVARHMGQITKRGEDLWRYGNPTRRHMALIAWAYTPDPEGVKKWIARAKSNPVQILPQTYMLGPRRWGAYHVFRQNPSVPLPLIDDDPSKAYDLYAFLSAAYDTENPLNPGAFDHATALREVNSAYALIDPEEKEKAARRYQNMMLKSSTASGATPEEAKSFAAGATRLQAKWKEPLDEAASRLEGPRRRFQTRNSKVREAEFRQGARRLNDLLQGKQVNWLGTYEQGVWQGDSSFVTVHDEKRLLRLPSDYTLQGAERGRDTDFTGTWYPGAGDDYAAQSSRYKALREAAQYWIRKKYGPPLWRLLGEDRKDGLVDAVVAEWSNTYGTQTRMIAKDRAGRVLYTELFEKIGLIPGNIGRAVTWSEGLSALMTTMEVVAREVTRRNIRQDRISVGKATAAQQAALHEFDFGTTITTPEEELEYSRGETAEAGQEKREDMLTQALRALEGEGPAGRTKAAIIQLHLGEPVVPGQPDRLLGRADAKGTRWAQTSRAYQDLSGEKWRLNKKSQLVDRPPGAKKTGPSPWSKKKYHPVGPEGSCPTCTAISRFFRIRGVGSAEVSTIIDDFRSSPLAENE